MKLSRIPYRLFNFHPAGLIKILGLGLCIVILGTALSCKQGNSGNHFVPGDAPEVSWVIPKDGETLVNVYSEITIAFTQEVDPSIGTITFEPDLAGSFRWRNPTVNNLYSFKATDPLPYATTITVTIHTDFISKENSKNLTNEVSFQFTTEPEPIPPTVIATDPSAASTGVALDSPILITFDQPMDETFGTIELSTGTQGAYSWFDDEHTQVLFQPSTIFPNNATIDVSVSTDFSLAVSRVPMDEAYTFSFSTLPSDTAPQIVSTSPADNSTDVPIDQPILILFDQPMKDAIGTISSTELSNSFTAAWQDVAQTTLSITPEQALPYNSKISFSLGVDFYSEYHAKPLEKSFEFSFYTQLDTSNLECETDSIPPVLTSSLTPAALDENPSQWSYSATFDETLQSSTFSKTQVELVPKDGLGNGVITSIEGTGTDFVVYFSGFQERERYDLVIHSGIKDLCGNATTDSQTIEIKVADGSKPSVLTSMPYEGMELVPNNINQILIHFSTSMDPSSCSLLLDCGGCAEGSFGAPTWDNNNTTVTIPIENGPLSAYTDYAVDLISCLDEFGNPLDITTYLSDGVLNFATSTLDSTAPFLILTDPTINAVDVAVNKNIISVYFNEQMNTSVGTATIDCGGCGLGSISVTSWNTNQTQAMLFLSGSLALETVYTVSFVDFEDLAGNSLSADVYLTMGAFSFITEKADSTNPFSVSSNPSPESIGVPINLANFTFRFNEPMDTSMGSLLIECPSCGSIVPVGSAVWNTDLSEVSFPLLSLLESNQSYSITLTGFKDQYQNDLDTSIYGTGGKINFTTILVEYTAPTIFNHSFPVKLLAKGTGSKTFWVNFSEPVLGVIPAINSVEIDQGSISSITGSGSGPYYIQADGLQNGIIYTVTFGSDIKDYSNNALAPKSADFGVANFSGIPPATSERVVMLDYYGSVVGATTSYTFTPSYTPVNDTSLTCAINGEEIVIGYLVKDYSLLTIDTIGSNFNTALQTWDPTDGSTIVQCDDNSGGILDARISTNRYACPGDEIFLTVDSFAGGWNATNQISINVQEHTFANLPISVVSFDPVDSATFVIPSSNISVEFSAPISHKKGTISLSDGNIILADYDLALNPPEVTFSNKSKTITINPWSDLPVSKTITVIFSDLEDTCGSDTYNSNSYSFDTVTAIHGPYTDAALFPTSVCMVSGFDSKDFLIAVSDAFTVSDIVVEFDMNVFDYWSEVVFTLTSPGGLSKVIYDALAPNSGGFCHNCSIQTGGSDTFPSPPPVDVWDYHFEPNISIPGDFVGTWSLGNWTVSVSDSCCCAIYPNEIVEGIRLYLIEY